LKAALKFSSDQTLEQIFLANQPSESRFAEAFRTLQTNIHFSFMDKTFRSLLITSAGQKEGKTSVLANLGFTLAKSGKSVLMLDADLRKPMLSRLASSRASHGLTGLLLDVFGMNIRTGSLDKMGISDVFRLLSFQKKSGILKLMDDQDEIELFFMNGELEDLNWLTKPEEKKLANILVDRGMVTRDHINLAIGRQREIDQKLGFILISMGLVNETDLKSPLNIQMLEGLRAVFQMKHPRYGFQDVTEPELITPAFNPVDFRRLYQQIIVGEETTPFLQERIHSIIVEISPNLYLIPSGKLPPNPTDIMGSAQLAYLMGYLKKKFDIVLIDSSPLIPASDALLLAPQTDGVVFVVQSGRVNRGLIRKAVDQLRHAKANLIGVVINKADVDTKSYYNYYSYYGTTHD